MAATEGDRWEQLRAAQEKLVERYIRHPDVRLIDIGLPPPDSSVTADVVLRIHLRARWFAAHPKSRGPFPEKIDGIPVVLMRGDYADETSER